MKKIVLFLSMLLAMGLSSACSSDEENPFVGEWQLVEVRYIDSGKIVYPSDENDGTIWFDHIIFFPNYEYKNYCEDMPMEDFPAMTYSYDHDILTVKLVESGYYSYKYEIYEKGNLLRLIPFVSDMNPGVVPQPVAIRTFKKIK